MKKTFAAALLVLPLLLQTPDPKTLLEQAIAILKQVESAIGVTSTTGTVTTLPATGDVQAAVNAAKCGDTIRLTAGATYTANLLLPAGKGCSSSSRITITTTGTLPAPGVRVSPATAAQMPKIKPAPGGVAGIRTAPASSHYVMRGLELLPLAGGVNDIVLMGDGSSAQNTLAQVPDDFIIDQCYVHGDATAGQKRGIALNASNVTVSNSYIAGMWAPGQDSQAVGGWNGPGPFTIRNNYLEAASENVIFGGADPAIPGLVPSDITIAGNYITKPIAWRALSGRNVKNAIEMKNARRVTITGNVLENVWQDAQVGFALVLTVRNQDGNCPQCTIQDVTFSGNIVRHAGAFLNLLAVDDGHDTSVRVPSVRAANISLLGNLVYDIDSVKWGGTGRLLQILDGPAGLTIDHNTIAPAAAGQWQNSLIDFNGSVGDSSLYPVERFTFTNNIGPEAEYGVLGGSLGIGTAMLAHFAPGYVWTGNTIIEGGGIVTGGGGAYSYPAGTVLRDGSVPTLGPDFTPVAGIVGGANIAALKTIAGVVIP